jgi:large subunit ribosomal protein L16
MLMPKKVKYRKQARADALRAQSLAGLDARVRRFRFEGARCRLDYGSADRSGRIAITRFVKRGGKVWIRIFPDKPVTKKPAETEWVKEKALRSTGSPSSSRADHLRDGRRSGIRGARSDEAGAAKLPLHTKFVDAA